METTADGTPTARDRHANGDPGPYADPIWPTFDIRQVADTDSALNGVFVSINVPVSPKGTWDRGMITVAVIGYVDDEKSVELMKGDEAAGQTLGTIYRVDDPGWEGYFDAPGRLAPDDPGNPTGQLQWVQLGRWDCQVEAITAVGIWWIAHREHVVAHQRSVPPMETFPAQPEESA